jgi:hypothetical protein
MTQRTWAALLSFAMVVVLGFTTELSTAVAHETAEAGHVPDIFSASAIVPESDSMAPQEVFIESPKDLPSLKDLGSAKVVKIHGQKTIVVPKKALASVSKVAQELSRSQSMADTACDKAKATLVDKAGAADKSDRHRAMLILHKFCNKMQSLVNTEMQKDVTEIAGKKAGLSAVESEDQEAVEETSLFKKHIGEATPIVGSKAKKMAKKSG